MQIWVFTLGPSPSSTFIGITLCALHYLTSSKARVTLKFLGVYTRTQPGIFNLHHHKKSESFTTSINTSLPSIIVSCSHDV